MESVANDVATGKACEKRPHVAPSSRLTPPAAVLIGASTGGPQALTTLVGVLAPVVPRTAICVTLHMPAELVPVIAKHISSSCGVATHVVQAEQPLLAGTVYFAPGDRHLCFRRHDNAVVLGLKYRRPSEFCKPAIDVMFASAASCFGARALAVVLSGMGRDGLAGARALVAAGSDVLVQDKASSAVWGMPGSVAKADLASAVLPPGELGDEIRRRLTPLGSIR